MELERKGDLSLFRAAQVIFALVPLLFLIGVAKAAEQTQTLRLDNKESGATWHSIWLYVEPTYDTGEPDAGQPKLVEDVFNHAAIEIVASPFQAVGTAEFVSEQTETFNPSTWAVWRKDSSQVANTLLRVRGYRAYLIRVGNQDSTSVPTSISIPIEGDVRYQTPKWEPASYSLVGFHITGNLTFSELFTASNDVHPLNSIKKLDPVNSAWTTVSPDNPVEDGTAYWVFSRRNSSYMGPVSVLFDGLESLSFGAGPGNIDVPDPDPLATEGDTILVSLEELTLTNASSSSSPQVSLSKVEPNTTGGSAATDELRLYEIIPREGTLDYIIGGSGQVTDWTIGDIQPTATKTVTIGAHRNWTSGARYRENLYRLNIGNLAYWLPVRAANAHLTGGSELDVNTSSAGLWVGGISLNEVSSLTEDGAPLRPAKTSAPLRMILHVDASGTVSLLSRVMIMRTKTADVSVPGETVLVIDENKIPFFEGIEERGGKRIGQRVETVAFDMPRNLTIGAQPTAFLTEVAGALGLVDVSDDPDPTQVTDENLRAYFATLEQRSPNLGEIYHNRWALDGGLVGGGIVSTPENGPLALDPFHRSNPFRHAFHPQHGTGFAIERHLRMIFDEQVDPDLLTGIYEETLTGPGGTFDTGTGLISSPIPGLASMSITMRGLISLQRISKTNELQG